MGKKTVMIDSCILIEYFRKADKSKSTWFQLVNSGFDLAMSVIVKYEVYAGATPQQIKFWKDTLADVSIIPLEDHCVDEAVAINSQLKLDRKQIEIADLLIAATAISNKMPLATLNKRHFERINMLELL
ncbi:type II toxin-antitoxin system VapC family toxin [Dyadobacter fermentans]|uniref:type II toxin-antitoxin system VapC family toxin n=1 Tax=Dyadobacter fermentans TaxID=94254 RepID=UPI001CC19784|nr:type II toxin-antitoxin system VapC family toxin [Dyadobacter fermentans]MBZ1362361.1 type II toxin-antitoxin system VapC family toxin [Dyadobacter fermentans]